MRCKSIKFTSILLIMTMIVTSMGGCTKENVPAVNNPGNASENAAEGKERPNALVIASGSSAGTYYYMATGQAKILSENIKGLTVNNEATNGSINYDLASENVDTIGMGGLEQLARAIEGKDQDPLDNIAAIQVGHKYVLYCLTMAKSGIKTMADLEGKKIGRSAFVGTMSPMLTMLYEAYGVDVNKLKEIPSTHADNIEALKDGTLDVIFVAGSVPMAGVTDLTSTDDIVFLDIDEKLIEPFMNSSGYYELITIEPNTYSGQTESINLLTVDVVLAANLNLDDDLVYEITKALNENTDEMAAIHVEGGMWNLENSLKIYNKDIVPFHPGAARYYDEMNKKE